MYKYALTLLLCLTGIGAIAQTDVAKKSKKHKHLIYASWGYNGEWYTHSDVKVSQPSLNNNYTLQDVVGHDHKGWDKTLFSSQLTIPQYNYRIGYMIDDEKGWGIELNFDHTKFIIADPQTIKIKGTYNNEAINSTVDFRYANGFYYYLNNGANFFLINAVKRWHILKTKNDIIKADLFGKVGVGPVVPHVENSFFGHANDPHFQLGGWNTGIEAALRVTVFKYGYIEYSNKLDYARYSNLKIYEGTVKQAFGTYEMILSVGASIPLGKK